MTDHTYRLSVDKYAHRDWRADRTPAMTVESGATITFECAPGTGDAIDPSTTAAEAEAAPFPGHMLTGPVEIETAQPGDVLEVEIQSVETADWGFTFIPPGASDDRGLLSEEFPEPYLYHWDLDKTGKFVDGIEVPLDPFPGTVGVAPAGKPQSTIPPRTVGGNMDISSLTAGSKLFVPVAVEGGLLSVGDGHAAQGDGEVCVTALETAITLTVEVTVHSDYSIETPRFVTPGQDQRDGSGYATVGIAKSLNMAAKRAIKAMVEDLVEHQGLTRQQAYVLCSVAVDLQINEVVNQPNVVVSALLPECVVESTHLCP